MASSLSSSTKTSDAESLSKRINEATIASHAHLNRMITTCLPLAVPPHSTDPSTYSTGILHIAPIYLQFEKSWDALLDASQHADRVAKGQPSKNASQAYFRERQRDITGSILQPLRVPGLRRSDRLRADIQSLTGYTDKLVSAALVSSGRLPSLKAFTDHIETSVVRSPHVLLAYSWVMYMAIFSGGRYLRATLQDAGEDFWTGETADPAKKQSTPVASEDSPKKYGRRGDPNNVMPGLSFFHFLGDQDGEDIKLEFKRRYAELELLLTDAEKDEVVQEAHIIFDSMGAIVEELDFLCRGTNDLEQIATKVAAPPAGGSKQTVRRLVRPLRRQFSTVGPKLGTITSMKASAGSTAASKSGVAWSMSVLCSVVAVGSAALLWRSLHGNIALLGFNSLDTTKS